MVTGAGFAGFVFFAYSTLCSRSVRVWSPFFFHFAFSPVCLVLTFQGSRRRPIAKSTLMATSNN